MDDDSRELLQLYLTDHLAGAVGGTELAKRAAKQQEGTPFEKPLATLAAEIEQDLAQLRAACEAVGIRSDAPVKEALASATEKLGRLKLNKRVVEQSPLSLVFELELLQGAVMAKRAVWHTVGTLVHEAPELEGFGIGDMADRAEDQNERLRSLHREAVAHAFPTAP